MNAGMGIQNRINQLQARLQAGVQSGEITRQEAQSLRPQLRQLTQLERQYSRNGLTQAERQELQQRIRNLRQQLRLADGGRNDRYTSWNEDDYYNQGGYGQGTYTGQGGPLEEIDCRSNGGGIGGIIGGILGVGNNDGCGLRVGQRASGNLYGVPYEYRDQYRDGNGIYYRTDGRMIYQIDARTNTVLRVYGAPR